MLPALVKSARVAAAAVAVVVSSAAAAVVVAVAVAIAIKPSFRRLSQRGSVIPSLVFLTLARSVVSGQYFHDE